MFNVAITHGHTHLLVVASGPARLPELCALAAMVATMSRMRGQRRALMDLLAVVPEITPSELTSLGEYAAQVLAALEKVAAVVNPLERRGTAERVAQGHGLALRTFTNLHEAEHWLLGR